MRFAHASFALALTTLAGAALAQPTITSLVKRNQWVPDIGFITTVDAIAVNNNGWWLVESDTDHADLNADRVLFRNGVVHVRENDAVPPSPAAISSFDSVNLNNNGDTGWNLNLRNTGGTSNDSGVYFNTSLLIQESMLSTAEDFTQGTPYIGFFECKTNDNNEILVVASVDDPAIASSVDRAIVVLRYDAGAGTFTEEVWAKEGDFPPGIVDGTQVVDFGTGTENFAFANDGRVMAAASLTGATATNGGLWIESTLIARKGDESPIAGRTYTDIGTSTKLDMNNNGDYVFKATISGDAATNLILVRNGQLFKQEGDTVPGVAGETIISFGTGPVRVTDNGDVVWWAQFTGDTTTNTALFINDTLLVRRGVTVVDGEILTTVSGTTGTGGITEGFTISDNGRYIVFRGVMSSTGVGAFMIDMGGGCLADFNGSGGTPDDADVAAFFDAWNLGDPRADVNASGGTPDDADVAYFFDRWNAGC
ncbi:MAG: hypothetical protein IPM33_04215 [Phycisphaerales bacterium]|nr:hypothetical protein [Phycisphaerales bacterium]